MNYHSRKLVGALIRIRNVCFSYRKSGVVSFFQDIERKKVELYGFFGNYPKKGSYILKKMEIRGYSGKMF